MDHSSAQQIGVEQGYVAVMSTTSASPNSDAATPQLSRSVRGLLGDVRRRIRVYVWLEGLAIAAIWLGLTFWVGLALDYLPVLFWASEIPLQVRLVALAGTAMVLAWILYHWVLHRAWVRLPDSSMALLLERSHPELKDGLLTTVELAEHTEAASWQPEMLARTASVAEQQAVGIDVRRVFNNRPLIKKWVWALVLCAPIALFATAQAKAFSIWMDRFYGMKDTPWPRSTRIEVAGLRVRRRLPGEPQARFAEMRLFENKTIKVGRGAQLELRVAADTSQEAVPEFCTAYYRHEGGSRGRVVLNPIGKEENDRQGFAISEKPFKGLQKSLTFDVQGLDHRVNGYRIEVVEPPLVIDTELICEFPQYLVDEQSGAWTPRSQPYLVGGVRLPQGARVRVRITANKPLREALLYQTQGESLQVLEPLTEGVDSDLAGRVVEFQAPELVGDLRFELALLDQDDVASETPHQVVLSAIEDTAPQVEVNLTGIGALVTPNVLLPMSGKIEDDYKVAEAWFDVQINQQAAPRRVPLKVDREGVVDDALDFRLESSGSPPLTLQPKDQLVISVQASDAYNLPNLETGEAGGPNIGAGGRTELTVVTVDELLEDLERKELGQRRRLEHVVEEFTAMRDSLVRVAQQIGGEKIGAEPGDLAPEPEAPASPEDVAKAEERARSLRTLRIQQAKLQAEKSAQEIFGVSSALDLIVLELINNRVDSEDRQKRLRDDVASPLQEIGEGLFPTLVERLEAMTDKVEPTPENAEQADQLVVQADEILVRLNDVLEKMLDIETYNELVDLLRTLLDEQGRISDETKSQRAKAALELLK